MSYEVETNIPCPAPRLRMKFPFDKMAVGASFALEKGPQAESARIAAIAYGKRHGMKFEGHVVEDSNLFRIWRVS